MRKTLFLFAFIALAAFSIHAQGCAPAPSGLAGWWQAEGNAVDLVSGSNGLIYAGATFVPGEVNQCFKLDGVSGCIMNTNTPQLTSVQNSFTMEFWAYPQKAVASLTSLGTDGESYVIFPDYGGTAGPAGVGVSMGTNGIAVIEHADGYMPSVLNCSLSITNWAHVAVVYSNKQPILYVNGVNVCTGTESARLFVYPGKDIGGNATSPWRSYGPYKGLLDEVSIYNRALSQSEITAIFNAGKFGKCYSPAPPSINVQPTNQVVAVGGSAIFTVVAGGSPVLTYQWSVNGTNLFAGTNATLTLINVQPSDGGVYSVLITNTFGSTNSAVANLTVMPAPPCEPAAAGLVGWWQAEGNPVDLISRRVGVIYAGTTFGLGEVGQAFNFNGSTGCVMNTNTPPLTNVQNSFTMEFWAYPQKATALLPQGGGVGSSGQSYAIFPDWGGTSGTRVGAGVSVGNNGICVVEHCDSYMPSMLTYTSALTGWVHVAVVYSNRQPTLYLNGDKVRTGNTSSKPIIYPSKNLGNAYGSVWQSYGPYQGLLDEVSIYNRALSQSEIAAIYSAGSSGKCINPTVITAQPTNQNVIVGGSANFVVVANGLGVLSYQWSFNGTNINGATNAQLAITNASIGNIGNYQVIVSSSSGSVTSIVAALTIQPQAATGTAIVVNNFLVGVSLTSSGFGYTNVPLVHVIGGGGSGAQVIAVVSNGMVIAFNVISAGSGYTNAPQVVVDPPFIFKPVLGIAPMSFLAFSNLTLGGSYQLQQSAAWYWTNLPVAFTATNGIYTQMVSGVASTSSYRLALNPAPAQAFATAQVFNGFVVGATVTSGGSGYFNTPTVQIVGGGGTNATAVAETSGGAVTQVTITSAGIGYTNTPTIRIAQPPAAAVTPTVFPVMRVDSADLAPYHNYQIQFMPDLFGTWADWSSGLFSPVAVTNSQFLFVTNSMGFFRLQHIP